MGQVEITRAVEFTFNAVQSRGTYPDGVEYLNGTDYRLVLGVRGEPELGTGEVIPGEVLNEMGRELVYQLHNKLLTALDDPSSPWFIPGFPSVPTPDNLVAWMAGILPGRLYRAAKYRVELAFIRLWDTPKTYSEWTKR